MFKKLKALLYSEEFRQADVAKKLKKSVTYVNERLTGKKPFSMDDVYSICDWLHIEYSEIPIYFPHGGKSTDNLRPIR